MIVVDNSRFWVVRRVCSFVLDSNGVTIADNPMTNASVANRHVMLLPPALARKETEFNVFSLSMSDRF